MLSRHWFPKHLLDYVKKANIEFVAIPFLCDRHWSSLEFSKLQDRVEINILEFYQGLSWDPISTVRLVALRLGVNVSIRSSLLPVPHGFCGWTLIRRWSVRHQVALPVGVSQDCIDVAALSFAEAGDELPPIIEVATQVRAGFLQTKPPAIDPCLFGCGTDDDASMQQVPNDPWMANSDKDPWMAGRSPCKWEDMRLPQQHGFELSDGSAALLINRLQVTPTKGGVAFATRAHVNDLVGVAPKAPTCLIVPHSQKFSATGLDPDSVQGPIEITVQDGVSGHLLKKQVMLIHVTKGITHKMPKPKYTATLDRMCEIVVETDSRCISKETLASIIANPHDQMKSRIIEQFPQSATKDLCVFAFRSLKNGEHQTLQIMIKIAETHRKNFLERSGAGDLFARDFRVAGEDPPDFVVIPRFFQVSRVGKEDALRISSRIAGFGGVVNTRRGLAIRAWNANVGDLRQILLSQDPRVVELNQSVIPRHMFNSSGWPAGAPPGQVVTATHHAIGLAPVLTRTFKTQGISTWTCGFASVPQTLRFSVQFNSHVSEIILSPVENFAKGNSKGRGKGGPKGKGKGKDAPSESSTIPSASSDRVTKLEAKFATLERRQDQLEDKVSGGFEKVQSDLRQILQALSSRPAPHEGSHTGCTPPPKAPKTSA